ncbi:MAG: hypothetical protein GY940_16370 [bacterium]|nr:hypothetical protein [bacterium]
MPVKKTVTLIFGILVLVFASLNCGGLSAEKYNQKIVHQHDQIQEKVHNFFYACKVKPGTIDARFAALKKQLQVAVSTVEDMGDCKGDKSLKLSAMTMLFYIKKAADGPLNSFAGISRKREGATENEQDELDAIKEKFDLGNLSLQKEFGTTQLAFARKFRLPRDSRFVALTQPSGTDGDSGTDTGTSTGADRRAHTYDKINSQIDYVNKYRPQHRQIPRLKRPSPRDLENRRKALEKLKKQRSMKYKKQPNKYKKIKKFKNRN